MGSRFVSGHDFDRAAEVLKKHSAGVAAFAATPATNRQRGGSARLRPCADTNHVVRGVFSTMVVILTIVISASAQITFREITAQAEIHFTHNNGAFGKKYLPETMGPGCAFIDYDNDGWPDIVLVNGPNWPGHPRTTSTGKLHDRNRRGSFTDVTRKAGLAIPTVG